MAPFPVPSAMFQCRVSPSYPSLPDQSPAHCSCPCGKVGANATVVSRRWPWPERWGKEKATSEKGKEKWGIQHTQKNHCDADPLSRGPTSVVPPPLLHQPNITPVPTLPGARAVTACPATQAHSGLALEAVPPAKQGTLGTWTGKKTWSWEWDSQILSNSIQVLNSEEEGNKRKTSVHVQIGCCFVPRQRN